MDLNVHLAVEVFSWFRRLQSHANMKQATQHIQILGHLNIALSEKDTKHNILQRKYWNVTVNYNPPTAAEFRYPGSANYRIVEKYNNKNNNNNNNNTYNHKLLLIHHNNSYQNYMRLERNGRLNWVKSIISSKPYITMKSSA